MVEVSVQIGVARLARARPFLVEFGHFCRRVIWRIFRANVAMLGRRVGRSKLNGAEVCDPEPLIDHAMAQIDRAELAVEALIETAELLEEGAA